MRGNKLPVSPGPCRDVRRVAKRVPASVRPKASRFPEVGLKEHPQRPPTFCPLSKSLSQAAPPHPPAPPKQSGASPGARLCAGTPSTGPPGRRDRSGGLGPGWCAAGDTERVGTLWPGPTASIT
uniref:Uncharacterized protein n=1 Tax=Molossus molossus TaxID=27622 RepID=A0A7J8HI17_MOLMO|nr:hypothetical protein HJG59_010930 [Molossus molossus]